MSFVGGAVTTVAGAHLELLAAVLASYLEVRVRITIFDDDPARGSRRAEALRARLAAGGVAPARLIVVVNPGSGPVQVALEP